MNGILKGGERTGIGKTTVTTAILSLLDNVVSFKCGPDYIDPMFHEFITGYASVNLDTYMTSEDTVKYLYKRHSNGKNIAVIEGMMGLYDGLNHEVNNHSGAYISKVLKVPVILVVDGRSIATSIAAIVKGFQSFDKEVNIKGVIINKVTESMYYYLKDAIEKHTNVICLGYLPFDKEIVIKDRYLGLMQTSEISDLKARIEKLKSIAKKTIDLEKIIEFSSEAGKINYTKYPDYNLKNYFKGLKVGIAKDKAFSFYYEDNISLMKNSGMEIYYFSPLNDKGLPEVDCLYIGGGYPEVYAKELQNNIEMKKAIKKFSEDGKFIYAECGGMMYLCNEIIQVNKDKYKMCGIFTHDVKISNKLSINKFGYINCKTADGISIRGHEFHYSDVVNVDDPKYYFNVNKSLSKNYWKCGFTKYNTIAGYPHIHFYSNLEFFKKLFIKAVER